MVNAWESCSWACGKCDRTHSELQEAEDCCSGWTTVKVRLFFAYCYRDRARRGIPLKAPNVCGHKHKTMEAADACGEKLYGKNPKSLADAEAKRMPFKYTVTSTYRTKKVRVK